MKILGTALEFLFLIILAPIIGFIVVAILAAKQFKHKLHWADCLRDFILGIAEQNSSHPAFSSVLTPRKDIKPLYTFGARKIHVIEDADGVPVIASDDSNIVFCHVHSDRMHYEIAKEILALESTVSSMTDSSEPS